MVLLENHSAPSEMLLPWATGLCGLLLALSCTYFWLLPKPLPGIPYNSEARGNILGDFPNMVKEVSKSGDLMTWLLRQHQRHSSPLTQIFINPLGGPTLLLSDMRESHDILLHRIKEFDRTSYVAAVFSGPFPNFHLQLQTGTEWKSHRRLLQDLMTPSFLEKVAAPAIYDSIHETAKLWMLKAQLAPEKAFSAASDIHHAALDAVLSFSFGKNFPYKVTNLQTELLAGLKEITSEDDRVIFPEAQLPTSIQALINITDSMEQIKSAAFPRLKWELISRLPRLALAIRQKDALIREELSKAVSTASRRDAAGHDDSWVQSAVDHIVSRETLYARKDNRTPSPFSPVMRDEVFGFLVAGHDTTSTTLAWGVKLLADHQPAQSRLRATLRRAFAAAVDDARAPECAEIMQARVPYLDAVIEEILRVGGTVPAIDRQATCDTVLLGHHVPKGTTVFMLANGPGMFAPGWAVEEEKRSASAQAEKERGRSVPEWERDDMAFFKPERWLVPAGGAERDDEKRWWEDAAFDAKAGPSMPFGGGVRGCFGRRLAYVEMRMFLVAVIWRFELLRCPEDVSGYEAYDGVVHTPKSCFVRLKLIPHT